MSPGKVKAHALHHVPGEGLHVRLGRREVQDALVHPFVPACNLAQERRKAFLQLGKQPLDRLDRDALVHLLGKGFKDRLVGVLADSHPFFQLEKPFHIGQLHLEVGPLEGLAPDHLAGLDHLAQLVLQLDGQHRLLVHLLNKAAKAGALILVFKAILLQPRLDLVPQPQGLRARDLLVGQLGQMRRGAAAEGPPLGGGAP